mmetsp:Transcript_51306/g.148965  ORF Transcript_51306/g.148965 Transcript_51306/m.148965 type:complete len:223 (+) Transcript_51306:177-845(+)
MLRMLHAHLHRRHPANVLGRRRSNLGLLDPLDRLDLLALGADFGAADGVETRIPARPSRPDGQLPLLQQQAGAVAGAGKGCCSVLTCERPLPAGSPAEQKAGRGSGCAQRGREQADGDPEPHDKRVLFDRGPLWREVRAQRGVGGLLHRGHLRAAASEAALRRGAGKPRALVLRRWEVDGSLALPRPVLEALSAARVAQAAPIAVPGLAAASAPAVLPYMEQ